MRNKQVFAGILAVALVFGMTVVGCDSFSKPEKVRQQGEGKTEDGTTLAKVVIPLPKSNARNIADAMANTNFFEAIFYRYNQAETEYLANYRSEASLDEGSIEIQIPVGMYDILVLAGNYDPQGNSLPSILLASGSVEKRNIVAGENIITMTLLSVDYAVSFPATVAVGAEINTSVQVTLRNPFLWTVLPEMTVSIYTETTSTRLFGSDAMPYSGFETGMTIHGEDTVHYSTIAPLTAGRERIRAIAIFADVSRPTWYLIQGSMVLWQLFNSEYPVYHGNFPANITFTNSALPQVIVNMEWGDE